MTRLLRRCWIWLNTPPIDVLAPPEEAIPREFGVVRATWARKRQLDALMGPSALPLRDRPRLTRVK